MKLLSNVIHDYNMCIIAGAVVIDQFTFRQDNLIYILTHWHSGTLSIIRPLPRHLQWMESWSDIHFKNN